MSAKYKSDRINEVADELFELLKEFIGKGQGQEPKAVVAKATRLIGWIEEGWADEDEAVRRAMDPSDEELGLEGEELTADNLTPEGMGPDDKEE